jgi:hypothetical protein
MPQPLARSLDGRIKITADLLYAEEVPAGERHGYLTLFIVATLRTKEVREFHLQDDRRIIAPLRSWALNFGLDV